MLVITSAGLTAAASTDCRRVEDCCLVLEWNSEEEVPQDIGSQADIAFTMEER